MEVPAGFLIQKLLISPCIRTVTFWSSLSTLNTSGFPGTKTGGSRGRVTLEDGQDQKNKGEGKAWNEVGAQDQE
jgi:hypothetical protein